MRRRNNRTTVSMLMLAACVSVVVLFHCTNGGSEIAGSGSSLGNGRIRAAVVDTGGLPLSGARVRCRLASYLADTLSEALAKRINFDTVTDENGRIDLIAPDTGSFRIEIDDSHGAGVIFDVSIAAPDDTSDLGIDTVRPFGAITGILLDDGGRPFRSFARIPGMERSVLTDEDGGFSISLPRGDFALRFDGAGLPQSKRIAEIAVESRVVSDIDTIRAASTCTSGACDSAIVRAMLDSLGHGDITLDSVMVRTNAAGRIHHLRLTELGITALPVQLAQLSRLDTLVLAGNELTELPPWLATMTGLRYFSVARNRFTDFPPVLLKMPWLVWLQLQENRISELPENIGVLRRLAHLLLYDNQIAAIPASVGGLSNIYWLNLRANLLTSLPPELGQLRKMEILSVKSNRLTGLPATLMELDALRIVKAENNRLCDVPDSLAAWLDERSLDWRSTQECASP